MITAADNFYDVLGVTVDSSSAEIKKAYYKKIRQYPNETHPEEFQILTKAYRTLHDPEKRLQYENKLNKKDTYFKLLETALDNIQIEQYTRALNQLEEMLEHYPNDLVILQKIAECYYGLGKFLNARDRLIELNYQYPNNEETLLYLGLTYSQLGGFVAAKAQFKKLVELIPSEPNYLMLLSNVYAKLGELEKAIEILEGYLDRRKETIHDFQLLFDLYLITMEADKSSYNEQIKKRIMSLSTNEEERKLLLSYLIKTCERIGSHASAFGEMVLMIKEVNDNRIIEVNQWLESTESHIRKDLVYYGDTVRNANFQRRTPKRNNAPDSRNSFNSVSNKPGGGGSLAVAILLGVISSFFITPVGGLIVGVIWYKNAVWLKKVLLILLIMVLIIIFFVMRLLENL